MVLWLIGMMGSMTAAVVLRLLNMWPRLGLSAPVMCAASHPQEVDDRLALHEGSCPMEGTQFASPGLPQNIGRVSFSLPQMPP